MQKVFLVFLILSFASVVSAEELSGFKHTTVQIDSIRPQLRQFDSRKIKSYQDNNDFKYKETKKSSSDSLLDHIWNWILFSLLRGIAFVMSNIITKILFYLGCLVLICFTLAKLLNLNITEIFYSSKKRSQKQISFEEENIHELNFEQLISAASQRGDYRTAVRFIFLFALKKLSDNNLIHWVPGKTTDDYLRELNQHQTRGMLQDLRLYFDYAWYGHFDINEPTFREIERLFNDFKRKLI